MLEISKNQEINVFDKILNEAVHLPGVRIKRSEFLNKSLSKYFNKDVVDKAIELNPALAGITKSELEKIVKSSINFEMKKLTALSAAAGVPGGLGLLVTVPGDFAQYFVHVIRIMQKLMYLYGWEEVFQDDDSIDDETLSILTLFLGVMFGVKAANKVIFSLAVGAGERVKKELVEKALTKGTIYPIVKKISLALNVKMTKKVFASGVAKMIPLLGAVTSGGLSFISFKSMTSKLKNHLENLPITEPGFYSNDGKALADEITIDVADIDENDFDIHLNDTDNS